MTNVDFGLWIVAQAGTETPGTTAGPVVPIGVRGSDATTGAAPVTGAPTPGGPPPGPAPKSGMDPIFWILPAMLLVMVLVSVFGGRKEKKRRQELLAGIKRGDRVQTMGGIIGTIAELGDDDVVLRLEEGRVRVAKSAIQGVLQSTRAPGATVESKPEVKAPV
ncbi:MAG: preprotein translocase subunit YajC [Planctomycetota bacterium]|nr:preprotein translocase subunit YajC [Planctomycetota bacterium]